MWIHRSPPHISLLDETLEDLNYFDLKGLQEKGFIKYIKWNRPAPAMITSASFRPFSSQIKVFSLIQVCEGKMDQSSGS